MTKLLERLRSRPKGHAHTEERRLIDRNGWALAWLALTFGITIIAAHIESGASRFTSPSWQFALWLPGSPATWGVSILISGLLLIYGCLRDSRRARHAGFFTGFLWFCALDATALLAFGHDMFDANPASTVNPLSVLSWTYLAWMYGSRMRLADKRYQS